MIKNKMLCRMTAAFTAVVMLMQIFQMSIYAASSSTDEKEDDPYFKGYGVSSEPFVISSRSELEKMAQLINSGEKKYISAYYVLESDIDMSSSEWEPIGNSANKFKGIFDGKGYSINDLSITKEASSVGLFGYIYSGTVKNVNLVNGAITAAKDAGGIAGYNAGTITNCTSSSMLSATGVNAGGIAGRNAGVIENCSVSGGVSSTASNVGGVAGINSGTIDGCTSEAVVSSDDEYAGGLAGTNTGTIINSGSVSYVSAVYAGGLAGNNTGTIANSYNIGDVGEGSEYAGGIAGKNSKTIKNCYNGEYINADAFVQGGIVGYNVKGTISECYYLAVGDTVAVGEKAGGTISAVTMTDKNMRNERFAETLNKNLQSGYATWDSSLSINDGFPFLLIAKQSDLKIVNGEQYQSGDATPASSDGKTSMVKYTAYASKWFTGGTGSVYYELVTEEDKKNKRITIDEDTGYIVFSPDRKEANTEIVILVTARDSNGYCTGNVTITINVNDLPENQSSVKNSKISKTKDEFNKEEGHEDNLSVELKMTLNGNSFMKILHNGNALTEGTDFTIKNDTEVTIKRAYLSTLDVGENVFTFVFTAGARPEITIDISDSSLETYTVIFMSDSKPYHIEEDVKRGSTLKLPDKPTKTDASFGGWYTRSGGRGEEFTAKTKVEDDLTLYAYWKTKRSSSSSSSSSKSTSSKEKTYTIKSSATKGGTITPVGSTKVDEGDSQRYTIKADSGYIISDVEVDGVSKGSISTYSFSSVKEGHTIKVTFKEDDGTGPNSVHKPYMRGYSDDTFRPDQPITRTEAAVIISRISNDFDEIKRYENTFYDVNADTWYQKYIGYAVSKGYITGYEGDVFLPDNYISRAEFCTLIHKYLGLKKSKKTTRFRDCKDHWADNYIKDLVDIEAIDGYQTGLFNPDGAITRAEAAKIVNAVRGRTPNIEPEMDNPFVDIDQYHWAYYEVMEATVEHTGKELHKAK